MGLPRDGALKDGYLPPHVAINALFCDAIQSFGSVASPSLE